MLANLSSIREEDAMLLPFRLTCAAADKLLSDRWDDMPEDFPFVLGIQEIHE